MTPAEFRRRLFAAMRAAGLNQSSAARLLGCSQVAVCGWLSGRRTPPGEAEAPLTREAVIERLESVTDV